MYHYEDNIRIEPCGCHVHAPTGLVTEYCETHAAENQQDDGDIVEIICFCWESLEKLYGPTKLDEVTHCPECGAAVTFTTDTSDVRGILSEVLGCAQDELELRVVSNVDTLVSGDWCDATVERVYAVIARRAERGDYA